jgi:hypothetical protein
MSNWLALSMAFLLCADADVPRVNGFRAPASPVTFPAGEEISVFPGAVPAETDGDSQAPTAPQAKTPPGTKTGPLTDDERLALIRYVSGEFAKAIKPLPGGKDGFIVHVGKPLSQDLLDSAVATHGAAINTGDKVQITKLEFQNHQIIVDLNGGGRGKKRLRDRIHIEMGGVPTAQTTSTQQDSGPPGLQPGAGSTVYLDFGKPLPDMSPDDLKRILAPLLDFTKQRSASVMWADTLPPEIKKAIQDRKATLGMDREMVVAAIGKPDHKVRERDPEGNDIEDWIYGQPPSKTVFVRFTGEHVTSIKQFPQ